MVKILILSIALVLSGCASANNPVERQANRSFLLDSEFKLGLDGIPLLEFLPDIKIGFGLHMRRPTIEEEVDLNLSKLGKWKGQETEKKKAPELSSPKPFSASGAEK